MYKKKPSHVCCVVGCKNQPLRTKFYRFPAADFKLPLRERWIAAVKRKNSDGTLWQPSRWSLICSYHFIGNAKSEHPLSPSYLPTIFPSKYSKTTLSDSSSKKKQKGSQGT